MPKFASKVCGILGILCIGAAPLSAAGVVPFPNAFAPNPGVAWITRSTAFMPPPSGAGPIGQDPTHPFVSNEEFRDTGRQPTLPVADLNNPILQPWVKEELRKRNEMVVAGKGELSPAANCWPVGVPAFTLLPIQPIFFIPGPKEVVIIWQGDHHQLRHVYLTDRHSARVAPSWFGESIGHYENGDTLVIDTIGLSNGISYIDNFRTPHSEKLHVVERFTLAADGNNLSAIAKVEDPDAYNAPITMMRQWFKVNEPMLETVCAENNGDRFHQNLYPIPEAGKPDF
jgi:hypothetical protein